MSSPIHSIYFSSILPAFLLYTFYSTWESIGLRREMKPYSIIQLHISTFSIAVNSGGSQKEFLYAPTARCRQPPVLCWRFSKAEPPLARAARKHAEVSLSIVVGSLATSTVMKYDRGCCRTLHQWLQWAAMLVRRSRSWWLHYTSYEEHYSRTSN